MARNTNTDGSSRPAEIPGDALGCIQITDGNTTTQDVALQPSPSVTLSGNVTDGSGHGWPLYARIDVAGDPASPFFTDPITGHYSIQLPANATYDVTFTAKLPGYQPLEQSIAVGGSDMTHDVQLQVTPDCTAPGYTEGTTPLQENFDGGNGFPPPGWNVTDPLADPCPRYRRGLVDHDVRSSLQAVAWARHDVDAD